MNKVESIYRKNIVLFGDFFWRTLQIFGREGTSFLAFLIVSNLILPEDLSLYTYVSSIVLLIVRFCDFGISSSTSKFTAELKAIDEDSIKSLVGGVLIVLTAIVTFASIILVLFGNALFPEAEGYLIYLLPVLILSPLFYLYDGVLRGLLKFRLVSIISFTSGIVTVALTYLLIRSFNLTGAIISQNIQYIILVVALALSFGRVALKFNKQLIGRVLKYAVIIGLANIGLYLYTRADVLILGKLEYLDYVAYYEIAYKIFSIILLPSTILGTVIAPRITARFASKNFNGLIDDFRQKSILLFITGVFCSVGIYFLLPLIQEYVFSQYEYALLHDFIVILLVLLPFRYISSFWTTGYMTPAGYAGLVAYPLLCWGVVNVALGYVFVTQLGAIGVMYATFISQVGYMITKDTTFLIKVVSKLKTSNKV